MGVLPCVLGTRMLRLHSMTTKATGANSLQPSTQLWTSHLLMATGVDLRPALPGLLVGGNESTPTMVENLEDKRQGRHCRHHYNDAGPPNQQGENTHRWTSTGGGRPGIYPTSLKGNTHKSLKETTESNKT